MRLALASASPRRRELLERVGLRFQIVAPRVDEARIDGEPVRALPLRLAEAKARAGLAMLGAAGGAVLGADTVVSLGEVELGKPRDREEARSFLSRLSQRDHLVTTAVYLLGPDGVGRSCSVETKVTFPRLTYAQLDWLADSGEGADKAGGYAVQGLAGALITKIEGSYTNVVGLPLGETLELLAQAGLELPWSAASARSLAAP